MIIQNKKLCIRVSQEDIDRMKILKKKHYINTSQYFRQTMVDLYNKMEKH